LKDFKGLEKKEKNHLELDLNSLNAGFDFSYAKNRNSNYKNVASFDASEIKSEKVLLEIFGKLKEKFSIENYVLKKVWLVKSEFETVDEGRLPFIPHIDKERYLKFMVYVTDVTEKDGPFFSCTEVNDIEVYESLRKKIQHSSKEKKRNVIKDFSIDFYKPIVGCMGDLIIFDTNLPHFAGAIDKGRERKVIRFDFEKSNWNKKSIKSYVKNIANFTKVKK